MTSVRRSPIFHGVLAEMAVQGAVQRALLGGKGGEGGREGAAMGGA